MAFNPSIAVLEQKYIELLDKKIARLESSSDGSEPKTTLVGLTTLVQMEHSYYGKGKEKLGFFDDGTEWRCIRNCQCKFH